MPGTGLETSLAEATMFLLEILLYLVGGSFVIGLVTLPFFFSVLAYIQAWFWAGDTIDDKRFRLLFKQLLWIGIPLFSIFGTVMALGYFGAPDMFSKRSNKKGPITQIFNDRYDNITREIVSKQKPVLPQNIKIDWKRAAITARKLIELDDESKKPVPTFNMEKIEEIFGRSREKGTLPPTPSPAIQTSTKIPPALLAFVTEIINRAQNGPINESTDNPLTADEIIAAESIFTSVVEATKAEQDSLAQKVRSIIMYILLLTGPIPCLVMFASVILGKRQFTLILRSLFRNFLRTSLTYLVIFVLTFVLCAIWSILDFLSALTQQQEGNLKGIITEKYQIPSQMKPSFRDNVIKLIKELPPDQQPDVIEDNIMTWAFVGGTLDPEKRTKENSIFFFCLEPKAVLKMMPGLEDLTGEQQRRLAVAAQKMEEDPRAVVIGAAKLREMKKRVGDRLRVTSLNYKDIVFEFTIIESFPEGTRWEQSACMNRKYLDDELSFYKGKTGRDHPLADKCMNLIWVRLPNQKAFESLSEKIANPKEFTPAVKMEIESSAYANFLSPYKSLLIFFRYVLSPGLLAITTLVISLVIGIAVRERRTEIAVLKVLGFKPPTILTLVLGEALLVGILSGFISTVTAFTIVNALGGIPLPIGFFGKFFIPENALWWGGAIGACTSLTGSIIPAINAYLIKASQVFSRVT